MLTSYGRANRALSAAAAMLRGYNSVYPLTNIERKHLVLLIACRLSCSVTLGAYSYAQNPENKYLLLHSEPAWKCLELIWSYDESRRVAVAKAADRLFDQACLYSDSRETTITCYDLVVPDPMVADLLESVRVKWAHTLHIEQEQSVEEPPKKKQKMKEINRHPVITFVTGNVKKREEVLRILSANNSNENETMGNSDNSTPLPFYLKNKKLDLPELQGDPVTIAREKCISAAKQIGGAVITEDTSLCFNALKGLPGPYVKHFLDSLGNEGLIKMLSGYEDKTAYAQTIVAFCPGPGEDPAIFDGRTQGTIVMPRSGETEAFGWDPIFEPLEGNVGKTYAEMTGKEKDSISHRKKAFLQLREFLLDDNNVPLKLM